ncbi:MAG: hypothetical protein IKL73_08885 [Lachnospiraceae bacterium]|nr:hypothetical protein [Lachnospiraceae bacterium]
MKKKIIIICGTLIIIMAICIGLKWPTIFQKGNPIPYIIAMTKISEDKSFIEVEEGTYITKKGDSSKLFDFIEESNNVEYLDQAGSAYIFSKGDDNLIISSETYWSKYTVWVVKR